MSYCKYAVQVGRNASNNLKKINNFHTRRSNTAYIYVYYNYYCGRNVLVVAIKCKI